MRTQSRDTSPEAERVLISLIRKAPISKRFGFVRSWTKTAVQSNQRNIQELHPEANQEEIAHIYVADHYGRTLADGLRTALQKKEIKISETADLLALMMPLAEAFERLTISYYIRGAVAISIYGMQRATTDVEIDADIRLKHLHPLLQLLASEYYIDEKAARDAIQHNTSFSGIHIGSLLKFDAFLSENSEFEQEVYRRVRRYALVENAYPFCLASPEDVVLMQLERYRAGGQRADDQWNDILGVLKVQGTELDFTYLQRWAAMLKVDDLLESAYSDAGLRESRYK
jgi:hypothetical protein